MFQSKHRIRVFEVVCCFDLHFKEGEREGEKDGEREREGGWNVTQQGVRAFRWL